MSTECMFIYLFLFLIYSFIFCFLFLFYSFSFNLMFHRKSETIQSHLLLIPYRFRCAKLTGGVSNNNTEYIGMMVIMPNENSSYCLWLMVGYPIFHGFVWMFCCLHAEKKKSLSFSYFSHTYEIVSQPTINQHVFRFKSGGNFW